MIAAEIAKESTILTENLRLWKLEIMQNYMVFVSTWYLFYHLIYIYLQ